MSNTANSFADKWRRNPDLAFSETLRQGSDINSWILRRNGFTNAEQLREYLSTKRRILDAGCGNGRISALLRAHSDPRKTEIVGIDLVAAEIARLNLAGAENVSFLTRDLLADLSDLGRFDFIYCQEVLHHTGQPATAFRNLRALLEPGGEIAIYVYRRKAPLREFADDFVRQQIAALPYERAIEACAQLAELGRVLHETGVRITVSTVDVLGIEAGEYDLQRFIYHFFLKCFWNPELSPHANAVVNYDWYHPEDATRHTPEEVRAWFSAADLAVLHEHVDHYGITVRGRA